MKVLLWILQLSDMKMSHALVCLWEEIFLFEIKKFENSYNLTWNLPVGLLHSTEEDRYKTLMSEVF